ncbi:MAG: G5 domain-containing protein [Chloroflexi bacterium]|nr:G5 domain-containing protein [Chloroflexota bacterium]
MRRPPLQVSRLTFRASRFPPHAFRLPPHISRFTLHLALALSLSACAPNATRAGPVNVSITADGQTQTVTTAGPTVREALAQAAIALGKDDKIMPPEFTAVGEGLAIKVIRVTEKLDVEQTVLPFERQTVKNEGLPEGETRLLQIGVNGVQETTYRTVYEDGVQVSRSVVRQHVVVDPVPEIVMIGSQASFVAVPVAGNLVYLSAGNAWVMRGTSGSRRPLTVSGDLDGRVFATTGDGALLLFTRVISYTQATPAFNSLWIINARTEGAKPVDVKIGNVLWAAWSPRLPDKPGDPNASYTFAFSTAEPRPTAPGWQANNDLLLADVDASAAVHGSRRLMGSSSGGVYGWWGTTFAWAPGGAALAYSQADSVGVVGLTDVVTPTLKPLTTFPVFQTYSDWVWTPTVAWSPDGRFVYTVAHSAPVAFEKPEDSPAFDVTAVASDGAYASPLAAQSGMWAAPMPAPAAEASGVYRVAYLQAITPLQSVNIRYYLAVMDRDGSNARRLFPPEGEIGLNPQTVAWSPDAKAIAVIRSGNLWIVDLTTGGAQQLTADGQASNPVWSK